MKTFLKKWNSSSQLIREGWPFFLKIPLGNKIFSKLVSHFIPYTGSISPIVLSISNGEAHVQLNDKKSVRNHLKSIHAIAMANLGEFTTGLSIISQLNDTDSAILVKLEVEYLKKARGTLIAKAKSEYHSVNTDTNIVVVAEIYNSENVVVAKVTGHWRIRPHQEKKG